MRRPIRALTLTLMLMLLIGRTARSAEPTGDSVPNGSAPLASLEKFVSADFCAALVVHPSRLAKGEVVKTIPLDSLLDMGWDRLTDSEKVKQAMRVDNLRRVTVFADLFPGGNQLFFPAVAIEFNSDVDGKALLHEVWKDLRVVSFHGHTYLSTVISGAPMAALVSDNRTILLAPEGTLNKMLEAKTDNAFVKQLRQTDLNHDLVFEYSADAAIDRITRVFNMPIQRALDDPHTDEILKMLVRDVKSASLLLDFSGEQLLRAKITSPNAEAAVRVQKMIASGRDTLAKKYDENGAAALALAPPPLREPLDGFLKQALHDFDVKASENSVSVLLPTPKNWPDLVRAAAALLGNLAKTPK